MKKILSSIFVLICCALPLTSFAYTTCTVGSSDFCSCFIKNCKSEFPAGECTYANLKPLIESVGIAKTCATQGQPSGPTSACVVAINSYLYNNPAESPTCKSIT